MFWNDVEWNRERKTIIDLSTTKPVEQFLLPFKNTNFTCKSLYKAFLGGLFVYVAQENNLSTETEEDKAVLYLQYIP